MDDLENLKQLYRLSFDDSEAYLDWFFENRFREDRVVTLRDGEGNVISALHLLEHRIVLGGRSLRCPFVFAAATLPEYRNKGNFEKVMIQTLYLLNETGVPLVELFPVNHRYYQKYGFVTVGKRNSYRVPMRKISEGGGSCRVRTCTEADAEYLFWLYHSFIGNGGRADCEEGASDSRQEKVFLNADGSFPGCDGYADRTKRDFLLLLEEIAAGGGQACLVFDETAARSGSDSATPCGYYFQEADGSVPELVLSDYRLLGEIGPIAGCSVTLPLWVAKGREMPGNQARIVNVRKLLSLLKFDRSVCAAVRLRVTDSVLCHNNVTLSLIVARGEVMVEPCGEADFELTVEELTALIFGAHGLYKLGLPEKLCEVFGNKNNICFDKF